MKIIKRILLVLAVCLSSVLFLKGSYLVEARDLSEIQEEIERYQTEINRLSSEADTLKNQIAQFNAQIYLTGLKILETEERITLLGGRIDQLEVSLDSLSKAFFTRVNETYKMKRLENAFVFIITSQDLSEAVIRYHYLKLIQEADRNLLVRLQTAQNTYQEEKTDQEVLQEELGEQKQVLGIQKVAKNELLVQTQSNEKRYQQLLAQALAEKAAIENALIAGVEVGPIARGEPIGLVGNSGYPGCSTGKHLHFEIRKGGSWTDPVPYLQNKTVQDEQSGQNPPPNTALGSGNWPWPIQDTVRLTQHYGNTPYSWKYTYSGGVHTGLDMVSTSTDVIRAPDNGTLYKSSQACGSSIINIVYIDHGNDLISLYLHVQ